jgi:hypothetical protein
MGYSRPLEILFFEEVLVAIPTNLVVDVDVALELHLVDSFP